MTRSCGENSMIDCPFFKIPLLASRLSQATVSVLIPIYQLLQERLAVPDDVAREQSDFWHAATPFHLAPTFMPAPWLEQIASTAKARMTRRMVSPQRER
jgi:hypothetical protein